MICVGIGKKISGNDAWLSPAAAYWYNRMLADGMPAGGITDAGRTYDEQVAIFTARYTTSYINSSRKDKRTWKGQAWWRKNGVASAATPGQSNHETGNALDLKPLQEAWVRAHGSKYHFICDRVTGEHWHVEFIGSSVVPTPAMPTNTGNVNTVPTTPNTLWRLIMTDIITAGIAAAYRTECGREPGQWEGDSRLLRALSSPDPLADLRQQIVDIDSSTESNRLFVAGLYKTLLGRDPESIAAVDEKINAVGGGDVDSGDKANRIIEMIKSSPEYKMKHPQG